MNKDKIEELLNMTKLAELVNAKQKEEEVSSAVKPVVSSVAKKTGEVVNKGAFALGKQIGKSSGMFSGFMDEYRKALRDEDDDKQ